MSLAAWSSMRAMRGETDESGASAGDGGELIAERLSGSGGQDEQGRRGRRWRRGRRPSWVGAERRSGRRFVKESFEVHATGSVSHVLRLCRL